jgi:hypothetical protein
MLGQLRDEMLARVFFEFAHRRILDHRIQLGGELVERV